jgi:S1-C subfamily serine protease
VLSLRLQADTAVRVREVAPGSPAAAAGIHVGDLVVSIGGRPARAVDEIHRILAPVAIGERIPVVVLRGTRLEELVVVGEAHEGA